MNYIDFIIIAIFVFYVWADFRRGFLRLTAELVGLAAAFLLALKFYGPLAELLAGANLPPMMLKPISFLIVWFLTQIVFYFAAKIISFYTPVVIKQSPINIYLGILPAIAKAIVFISVMLLLFVVVPSSPAIKLAETESFLGSRIINSSIKLEAELEAVFSDSSESLIYLTNKNANDETTALGFTSQSDKIDEVSENRLIDRINYERLQAGLQPVKEDILIRNVARAHSRDMLIKGYFSHNSQDGRNLMQRLVQAGVSFNSAAENLALAPTAELAHVGLMNSPKHRVNILNPSFTRVGIGVIDAGDNGIMVTQDFAN
jgi:uncharacterized protein YkwD